MIVRAVSERGQRSLDNLVGCPLSLAGEVCRRGVHLRSFGAGPNSRCRVTK